MDEFQYAFPRRPYLDGRIIYKGYWGLGKARSTRNLVNIAVNNGMLNPKTNKPPHWTGCWKAAWRWALLKENRQEAYDVFQAAMVDEGKFYTMGQFKKMLAEMYADAHQPRNEVQLRRFASQQDLPELLEVYNIEP